MAIAIGMCTRVHCGKTNKDSPPPLLSRITSRLQLRPGLAGDSITFSSFSPMADPYRSREGLSTRSAAYGGYSDEVQVRIDPDIDDEVTGLRKQVRRLRDVAQEIETEAKSQNDFLNQLQMTLIKAQAGVKNNMRRLNKSIVREGSSHVMHVVLFALLLFFVVYLLAKFTRR
ncbi:Bet1-like protein [Sesamum alatum]|uniref:Bet1-like protein n=1 Tax=Sesamum alatum TaxID=300844 RepID=A0AAE1XYU1_9LAMI|nr:Bet1-like protein [Sesamum alatum]